MSTRPLPVAAAGLAILLAAPLLASTGELPITTSSPEARQLYVQARDKAENLELEAAQKLADQAIEKDPEFAMAYALRANASSAFSTFRENLDKAASLVDKVSPGEREWILAAKAQADGDVAATRQHLQALESQFPADPHVLLRIARFDRTEGNDSKAAEMYRKVTHASSSFAPAFNELGYVLVALHDFPGAEAAFRKYIALLPDSPNPYDSYGEMLMKAGRYDASIAQYRKALARNPQFVSSLAGIGMNQVLQKKYDAARATFEEERMKAPDLDGQLDALENVAKSYVHEGNAAKAVEVYNDVAARASERPLRAVTAHVNAARVLAMHDPSAALPQIERAEQAASASSIPAPVRARVDAGISLARAEALAGGGQFDAAHAELDKARAGIEQRNIPAEVKQLNTAMGTVALGQKRYSEALTYLRKGDDQDPFTLYERAVAEAGLGETRQASQLFAQAAKWNANDFGYALIHQDAAERASSEAVATAGRKMPAKKR